MQSGAWQSFEELEEHLTLDELYILYNEATNKEIRMMQGVSQAFGGEQDIRFGPPEIQQTDDDGGDVLESLFGRVSEKLGRKIDTNPETNELRGMKIGYHKN